jgi:class 3 adenylate cyclase
MDMQREVEKINATYGTSIRLRIGINQGPAIAGVIGRAKFSYDLWGDTVNIASRLESMGRPGGIQISEGVYARVKELYPCERHDLVDAKTGALISSYRLISQSDSELERAAA